MSRDQGAQRPILTTAVLALLVIASALEWNWVWGLLFAYWTAIGISRSETFLLAPIARSTQPRLFWATTVMWANFAVWSFIDFAS